MAAEGKKGPVSSMILDNIMEIALREKFLHERIKVAGKAGNLDYSFTVTGDKRYTRLPRSNIPLFLYSEIQTFAVTEFFMICVNIW